jgi:hypothetical protein
LLKARGREVILPFGLPLLSNVTMDMVVTVILDCMDKTEEAWEPWHGGTHILVLDCLFMDDCNGETSFYFILAVAILDFYYSS